MGGDGSVVPVHKHDLAKQSMQPKGFGHSAKRRIRRNDYSLQDETPLFRQTVMVRDKADRRIAGIATVHQEPDIMGGKPED
jgi:hypothetical protein